MVDGLKFDPAVIGRLKSLIPDTSDVRPLEIPLSVVERFERAMGVETSSNTAPSPLQTLFAYSAGGDNAQLDSAARDIALALEDGAWRDSGAYSISIILKPDVLDGSEIRLVARGREVDVAIIPATASAGDFVARSIPQLESHLASRLRSWSFKVTVCKERGRDKSRNSK